MLSCQVKTHKQREFRGPGGCVGIVAKSSNNNASKTNGLSKGRRETLSSYSRFVSDWATIEMKQHWETTSDKLLTKSVLNRQVEDALENREKVVEYRRNKLRDLLEDELNCQCEEIQKTVETTADRAEMFRKKAAELECARKLDIENLRQEKLNQRFLINNPVIKDWVTKKRLRDIAEDNLKQIEIKKAIDEKRRKENEWFSCLWMRDAEMKAEKEKIEAERKFQRKKENLELLQQQRAARCAQKMREKELHEKEVEEIMKLGKDLSLEQDNLRIHKAKIREDMCKSWSEAIADKNAKLERQREQDRIFADQIINGDKGHHEELIKAHNKKKQLFAQQRQFLAYRRELLKEEKEQEDIMKTTLHEYEESVMAKRDAELAARKRARDHLQKDAEYCWSEQLKEKRKIQEEAKRKIIEQKDNVHKQMEEDKRVEDDAMAARRKKAFEYKRALNGQIKCNEEIALKIQQEDERFNKKAQEAEQQFNVYMQKLIESNKLDAKETPLRNRAGKGDKTVFMWPGDLDAMIRVKNASLGLR